LILKAARGLYGYFWMYWGFLYIGVVGLAYNVVCWALHPLVHGPAPARTARRVFSMLMRVFFRMLIAAGVLRVDLSALYALRGRGGIIIAPNHPSMLDALFVISRIPDVGCIMKAPIWDHPILGGAARLMSYIRNDAPLSMVRQAVEGLAGGVPLLVFPEGTRTRRKPVNAFKGGFALIAKKAQVPIQTVFIETANPFLGKGWPPLKKPVFPLVYHVRLGRAFIVEGSVRTFVRGLEQYYRDELSGPLATQAVVEPAPAARPGAAV